VQAGGNDKQGHVPAMTSPGGEGGHTAASRTRTREGKGAAAAKERR
jgi:hypothetical protein